MHNNTPCHDARVHSCMCRYCESGSLVDCGGGRAGACAALLRPCSTIRQHVSSVGLPPSAVHSVHQAEHSYTSGALWLQEPPASRQPLPGITTYPVISHRDAQHCGITLIRHSAFQWQVQLSLQLIHAISGLSWVLLKPSTLQLGQGTRP